MKPILDNPYGYKICYTEGNSKVLTRVFKTYNYKQAKHYKQMEYKYPRKDKKNKPRKLKWFIIPITRKEVLAGIWRECPF